MILCRIVFSFSLCVFGNLVPPVLLAVRPDTLAIEKIRTSRPTPIEIKILHIFISADVNEVRFDNIWVFQRPALNGPRGSRLGGSPWQVNISLPPQAVVYSFDEPNETQLLADQSAICKKMPADSLIDSVGFSFALPNNNGSCRTYIPLPYPVDSMAVCVSGSKVQLKSPVLKFNKIKPLRSRFSAIYTANNLAAGAKVEINLSGLPGKHSYLLEIICVVGLVLLILIALFTLYFKRKPIHEVAVAKG